jgi:outer membrane protein TolC
MAVLTLSLLLGACAHAPDSQQLQTLAQGRAATQALAITAVQADSARQAEQWRDADWADLASHALRVNLQWQVAEVARWLSQASAEQALSQVLPTWSNSRTVIRRNVDDVQSSGSNAGTARVVTSHEWAWDVAGAGGLWLRAHAAEQRSAQSQLAMQAAVQQVLLNFDLTLAQAHAAQNLAPLIMDSLTAVDQALALTRRLMPLGLQDPLQIALWQDGLIELRRQLMTEQDQAQTALERMAALLQLPDQRLLPQRLPLPPRPITDVLAGLHQASWPTQARLALQQRRELRELDLELEALRLEQLGAWFLGLPTLRLQHTSDGDTSPTLVNNRWKERGYSGSLSLTGLISAWHQHRILGQTHERERLRQQLLAFSVIEQLRLARLDLASALSRAELADTTQHIRAQQRDLRLARTPFQDNDDIEQARAVALHALAVAAHTRAEADVQRAWQQWQLSIGLDLSQDLGGSPLEPTDLQPAALRQRWRALTSALAS